MHTQGTAPFLISPIDGIKSMASNVTTAKGCDVKCTDDSGFKEAVTAAQNAQAVMVVIGLDQSQERYNGYITDNCYGLLIIVKVMIVMTYLCLANKKTSLWPLGVPPRTL